MSGLVRDVTEIELAYEALRESEERFRTLCNQCIDGVALVRAGRIVYANQIWIELSGHSPDDLVGHSPMEFVAPDERDGFETALQALERGEAQTTAVVRGLKKSGELMTVEARMRLVNISGERAILAVVRDISSQTSQEEELRGALEKARIALTEAAQFLPLDSVADREASKALTSIYEVSRDSGRH